MAAKLRKRLCCPCLANQTVQDETNLGLPKDNVLNKQKQMEVSKPNLVTVETGYKCDLPRDTPFLSRQLEKTLFHEANPPRRHISPKSRDHVVNEVSSAWPIEISPKSNSGIEVYSCSQRSRLTNKFQRGSCNEVASSPIRKGHTTQELVTHTALTTRSRPSRSKTWCFSERVSFLNRDRFNVHKSDSGHSLSIGKGGFGDVYTGDLTLDNGVTKTVCIKKYFSTNLKYCALEYVVTKILEDTGFVPKIYGLLPTGDLDGTGSFALVMEYLANGQTLCKFLLNSRRSGVSILLCIRILMKIVKALQTIHEKGILYNDLKTDNVLIEKLSSNEANIFVIDFGLGSVCEGRVFKSKFEPLSDFPQVAPEVKIKRRATSVETDIYSLGCLIIDVADDINVFNGGSFLNQIRRLGEMAMEESPVKRPSLNFLYAALVVMETRAMAPIGVG